MADELYDKKKIKLPQLKAFKDDLDENYFSPIQKDINDINDVLKDTLSDEYNENIPYEVGDYCIYDNKLYECIYAVETPMPFDGSHWEKVNIPQRIIPKGGDVGQVLSKINGTDFNVEWVNNPPVDPSAVIDDEHTNSSTTWSSSKINNELLNRVYPVGAIYMSVNSTNPSTLFGGTWVKLENRFLIGASSSYPVNGTGGEKNHTLSVTEMPKHSHTVSISQGGLHSHSVGLWKSDEGRWLNVGHAVKMLNATNGSTNPFTLSITIDSAETIFALALKGNEGQHSHTASASVAGSGGAHNNMPPYLSVYMWKRTA